MKQIIKNLLIAGNSSISITYRCHTTSTNSEYIEVYIGGNLVKIINDSEPKGCAEMLNDAVKELNSEYPNLHIISKKTEFHFYYPGFNSSSSRIVPVQISNNDITTEVPKTGKVSEKYEMIGKSKVLGIIANHPNFELYLRTGFGFRGAQDHPTNLTELQKTLDWMCCADLEVIDNEIHVNAFSYHDMD